jgi:very-short-patch-repair endonuclease
MIKNNCIVCGKEFSIPFAWMKRGGKYCSQACYNTIKNKKIFRICIVCGNGFECRRTRLTSVCSRKCCNENKQITKKCAVCGKIFTVAKSNADRYTVCSIECRMTTVFYTNCIRCGKKITNSSGGVKHCSEECRRPAFIKICPTCGKEFRCTPATNKIYCSTSCYRKNTGETSPEKNVRICLEMLNVKYLQEHIFNGWKYPVDFYVPEFNIVIEVDGEYWHSKQSSKDRDKRKTNWLESKGYKVFRISDAPFYGKVTDEMINVIRELLS